MSFIAYATGSELVYSRYKKLLKKMAVITFTITLSVYVIVSTVLQARHAPSKRRRHGGMAAERPRAAIATLRTPRSPSCA